MSKSCEPFILAENNVVLWRKNIVVVGAGGHAVEVCNAIEELGHNVYVVSLVPDERHCFIQDVNVLRHQYEGFIVAIGDNDIREQHYKRMLSVMPPVIVIHPTAWVSKHAKLGPGTYIGPKAVIQRARIGTNCIINSGAIVSHDCTIEDVCNISPGAVLCGNTTVRTHAFVGANAVVRQQLSIGTRAVIGCGAVVVKHVPANITVVGNPARQIVYKRTQK